MMQIATFNQEILSYAELPKSTGTMSITDRIAVDRPRVLCFSRDPILGETRRLVLQRRYDVISVSSLQELALLPASAAFNIIVLCHTLSSNDCEACLQMAHEIWPRARVVAIASHSATRLPKSDQVVFGLAGPSALLNAVQKALQPMPPAGLPS